MIIMLLHSWNSVRLNDDARQRAEDMEDLRMMQKIEQRFIQNGNQILMYFP